MTKTVEYSENNEICRLCYNCQNTTETINIYSESGLIYNFQTKINKYLYLQVSQNDDLPKSICLSCFKCIEDFHTFYEKINDTQRLVLKDRYDNFALKAIYHNSTILLQHDISPQKSFIVTPDDNLQTLNEEEAEVEIREIEIPNDEIVDDVIEEVKIEEDSIKSENVHYILNTAEVESEIKEIEQEAEQFSPNTRSKAVKDETILPRRESLREKKKSIQKIVEIESDFDFEDDDLDEDFELTMKEDDSPKAEENFSEQEIELNESNVKKKRGRPKGVRNRNEKSSSSVKQNKNVIKDSLRVRRSTPRKNKDLPMHEIEDGEGESENEFPARDSDNEDWPAQTTLDEFPDKILENGLLLVKGKKLMTMICKFYKLECDLCEQGKSRFRHLRQLFSHFETEHNEDGYVSCCQTKLSRYPAIIMHMARHLQPTAFKCDICGYMVTRPRFLESHKQTHLPEDQKPYGCEQCPRRFCWKGALQIHLISHQPVGERKLYVCHMCGKVYDTPGGLSTHKKLVHTDKKPESHVCHVCAKRFATRTGLNEHMATIHQPREKDQVQCTDCGKWLMNQRCLKSHMILHSQIIYNCHNCDYSTKKQMLLRRHLLTQHSDEKPFSCETCGKTFKLKRALTVHVAQHNNTKTYKCTFCERVFASSTNFYTHRKNMHPLELQAMKDAELEKQRQKRIKAGIEEDHNMSMEEITSPVTIEQIETSVLSDDQIISIQTRYTGMNGEEHHIIQTSEEQPMILTLELSQQENDPYEQSQS